MTPHRPRANRRLQAILTAAIGQYFGIPREAPTITIILETTSLFRWLEALFMDHVERMQCGVAGEEAHGIFLVVFRASSEVRRTIFFDLNGVRTARPRRAPSGRVN